MALVPTALRPAEFNEKFLTAAHSHIACFNLFLNHYIKEIPKTLGSVYIDVSSIPSVTPLDPHHFPNEYISVSVSRIDIGVPQRWDGEGHGDVRQFPFHARLAHLTYGAPLYTTYVWNRSNGAKIKELTVLSGICPIMVRSNRCHLNLLTPLEIAKLGREDIDETGGYFIINGNERCIRFVIQQRCNHPIAVRKAKFQDRDIFYTSSAVLYRSLRSDGTSTNNIIFYTEDNHCVFRILLNRREWTCPLWVLLKALFPKLQNKFVAQYIHNLVQDLPQGAQPAGAPAASSETFNHLKLLLNDLWTDMINYGESQVALHDYHEDRYLHHLGAQFYQEGVGAGIAGPGATYEDVGRYIINNFIVINTTSWNAKFEIILLMLNKLILLKFDMIKADNIDSFSFQEVLGAGQLFAAVLKDSLSNTLNQIKAAYLFEVRGARTGAMSLQAVGPEGSPPLGDDVVDRIIRRFADGPARALSYFAATGNIRTFQLDLQQTAGWTITADKLNMNRFVAHFRSIHRGQFFAKMRTTEVRKLIGETWGFVCPVHTPDGPCCGLLLHMSKDAVVVSDIDGAGPPGAPPGATFRSVVVDWLSSQGYQTNMTGRVMAPTLICSSAGFPIVVDGEPVCRLPRSSFTHVFRELKRLKQQGLHGFPKQVEICAFPHDSGCQEGIFLFSAPGRLVRPVKDIATQSIEWIGPLAQPWLKIACFESDVEVSKRARDQQNQTISRMLKNTDEHKMTDAASEDASTTADESQPLCQNAPVDYDYVEISPTSFLSINASFTPLTNHNPSPRNMYQCQMLKQTMGTPFHNIAYRTDNKTYRLLTPNRPLFRTSDYNEYNFDYYGSGTNAVVAVISYTGFDMEDAMIINKHAMERGIFNGCVYKTKVVDAAPAGCRLIEMRNFVFSNKAASGRKWEAGLDLDGLPPIGTKLVRGSPLYRTEDLRLRTLDSADIEGHAGHVHAYAEDEEAYVEKVHLITSSSDNAGGKKSGLAASPPACQRALITLRCVRRPILGDKFASRAGQKGILSLLYPPEDLPFSASGIVPDLVFNPHGFPSRMTIGMVVESVAGKLAAITGEYQNASPFMPYPQPPKCNGEDAPANRWVDQGGYSGWRKRGYKYATEPPAPTASAVDYFGQQLLSHGYQYYGCETMYSGIHGCEMKCQIFLGIIYYQRLRHMVSDKWQCRSLGPIDHLTRQPLKGRKRGGGVRLGEMERDALLGHGASFMLQDRLLYCSDGHYSHVCPKCGSILSPCVQLSDKETKRGGLPNPVCRVCNVPCRRLLLPYIFRYISNELAAMNIAIKLQLSECDKPVRPPKPVVIEPPLSAVQSTPTVKVKDEQHP